MKPRGFFLPLFIFLLFGTYIIYCYCQGYRFGDVDKVAMDLVREIGYKRFYRTSFLPLGDRNKGRVKTTYETGELKAIETYGKGKKEGLALQYGPQGGLLSEIMYQNDLFDGYQRIYYPAGGLQEEGFYRAGKKDGIFRFYDQMGRIQKEESYKADQLDGLKKEYYEKTDGRLHYETMYARGRLNGQQKTYYKDSGKLMRVAEYRDDILHGVVQYFYPSGELRQEIEVDEGKLNGVSQEFYEDGSMKCLGYYIDGEKDGEFEIFISGILNKKEIYSLGTLRKRQFFDILGNMEYEEIVGEGLKFPGAP